jgi:CBS domain-containing protein
LRTDAYAQRFADGRLELVADEPLDVDRVVALPRLAGAPLDGIPQTVDGFIPVDDHGRVQGVADVFAAGDVTSFPVKHGGLATQQALAAAEMIAATVGASVNPQPFRPVVHGLLLTGSEPRFLRRELHGTTDTEPVAAKDPLWWPPAKIAGRHLGPFLARFAGQPEHDLEPSGDALAVHVALDPDSLDRLDVGRFPARDESTAEEMDAGTVAPMAVCEVAPEDTLAEIAERMLHDDLSATLVCEYGRLVGIVTTHDLIGAFAARAHPSEARARQWMTAEPITLELGASHAAASRLMRAYGIRHLPLVEGDRPVGMLRLEDELPAKLPVGLGF